jgi:hypothetical protein
MDDRTRPDSNVVVLRRKGDPSEHERERVASTIFAEPDDIATFSRGNLVPPRPDSRDDDQEPAPSPDPFFDRLQEASKTDGTHPADLADDGDSTDAYFDRLATQSPADMSVSGARSPAVMPMPGSAQLTAELAGPNRHGHRLRGRLIPPALTIRPWAAIRRSRFAWLLSVATLGALAALGVGIAVISEFGSSGSERQQSQREANASSLEPMRPDVLAVSADPFAPMGPERLEDVARRLVLGDAVTAARFRPPADYVAVLVDLALLDDQRRLEPRMVVGAAPVRHQGALPPLDMRCQRIARVLGPVPANPGAQITPAMT